MIFYKDIPDLNEQLAKLPELDYDYAYNSQDLREGYFIFKKKGGTSFSWDNPEGFYFKGIGDRTKRSDLRRIVIMQEGPGLAEGYVLSDNYIRLIRKAGDKIPLEKFRDIVVLELNLNRDESDICMYNGKEKAVNGHGRAINPEDF